MRKDILFEIPKLSRCISLEFVLDENAKTWIKTQIYVPTRALRVCKLNYSNIGALSLAYRLVLQFTENKLPSLTDSSAGERCTNEASCYNHLAESAALHNRNGH